MSEAGRYRPDADAVAREFLRPDHAHGFDPGFGRAVVALPGIADTGNAGNVHDHAAVAEFDHVRGSFTRAQEHAAEIHADDGIPLVHRHASDHGAVLHFHEQSVAHDAGIVHEAVQSAEVGRDARHGGADFAFVGDVHTITARLDRLGRAQRCWSRSRSSAFRSKRAISAPCCGELQGYRPANAAPRTGHHDCLIANIHDASFAFPTIILSVFLCFRVAVVRSFWTRRRCGR